MFFVWNLGSQAANLSAFNALNNAADTVSAHGSDNLKTFFSQYGLNYPNGQGTQRYADPVVHSDGRVAMPVPTVPFSLASQALKDELWTLVTPPSTTVADLTSDWFPAAAP